MENNIKIERKGEKIVNFLKKYVYFIVAGLIVVAITLTVILTTVKATIVEEDPPVVETNTGAITFQLPLLNCTVATDYAVDKLIYNRTLGWFENHPSVELVSTTSSDVLAAYAGTVTNVYTNRLEGTVVVIKHNDSLSTVYGSLGEGVTIKIGDTVTTGQKIGTTSISAGNEALTGAHLHFEILKDNSDVNPNDYLELGNK